MSLIAYYGFPGVGKTTRIIRALQKAKEQGKQTQLFLCSDSADLRARPHVKTGGQMGCRTPKLNWTIDHFVSAKDAVKMLAKIPSGTLTAFDEASWFGINIVASWAEAANRGVDIILGSISEEQKYELRRLGFTPTELKASCMLCDNEEASEIFYYKIPDKRNNMILICELCKKAIKFNSQRSSSKRQLNETDLQFLEELREIEPFPGKKHAYQPLYEIPTRGWKYVRYDTELRADLMLKTYLEFYGDPTQADNNGNNISYIDLGCCTGYFCEFMAKHGFASSGVDVNKKFITLAKKVTQAWQNNVGYLQSNVLKFLEENTDKQYDVTSSFATIQWVIAQSGYDEGLKCFDWLFKATKKMCALELGYTSEDIYKDKLPLDIDKEWIIKTMKERGHFDKIIFFNKEEHGLWRDLYIGFINPKEKSDTWYLPIEGNKSAVRQIGTADGFFKDGWVGEKASALLLCEKSLGCFSIKGTTANFLKRKCSVTLKVGDQSTKVVTRPGKSFKIGLNSERNRGDVILLEIEGNRSKSPKEAGINEDIRKLFFQLQALEVR
ncbi:class I SAM-dependent methyltransferase [Thermodesulfobacteriota bacterium]